MAIKLIEFDYVSRALEGTGNYSHYQVLVYNFDRENIHGFSVNYLNDEEKETLYEYKKRHDFLDRDNIENYVEQELNSIYEKCNRWFKTRKIFNIKEITVNT